MEGRRHSLDLPITKTLVALRRVRSLRDPSTNSMSKFSALIDDLSWETDSQNGICLRFVNGGNEGIRGKDSLLGCGRLARFREDEEDVRNFELCDDSVIPNSELASSLAKDFVRNAKSGPILEGTESEDDVVGRKIRSKTHEVECQDDRVESAHISLSNHLLENQDSNRDLDFALPSLSCDNHALPKQKRLYLNQARSPKSFGDMSGMTSPYPCPTSSVLGGSTPATSLYADEDDDDVLDRDFHGCTVSCCWSRTPRYRSPTDISDDEDCALLSGDAGGTATNVSEQSSIWKNVNRDIISYSGSPASLSQKYRPRSFKELVGQSLVARSILCAISMGRITSLYIFHGPRGTGKTSASRIFAAALNCLALEDQKPCGMCNECVLYFTGKSSDVKEVDSARISHGNRVKSVVKNATLPPVSSRYKVIIVDECQLLKDETWVTLFHNMDNFSRRVVFIMITPDLDKLPRGAVARSQKYHFPKIPDADIANRLGKICVQEGLEFDHDALDLIAAKSNGSLRDAEMMLDQLSLLGKRITVALAYDLIGSVSDDELLHLLDLAMSSDTTNTVRRARELMRSRIDPMQLISQLANLIMDILAGKHEASNSTSQRNFLKRHTSEMDLQKLQHALKILSDCEKQLRTSKNQTTWLTVALLQLNSGDSDANESTVPLTPTNIENGDCCCTSSQDERSKHLATYEYQNIIKMHDMSDRSFEEYVRELESVWTRATETCQSSQLRNLMRKRGKLSSISIENCVAVAELEFSRPNDVTKAEKSWKVIASLLQSVLGCNIEIRINLSPNAPLTNLAKVRRFSSRFFSCSCRMHHGSNSLTENGSNNSGISNFTSNEAVTGDKPMDTSSSGCLSQFSREGNLKNEAVSTIRNSDGNALSTGATTPHRSSRDCLFSDSGFGVDSSMEDGSIEKLKVLDVPEQDIQPKCNCFCRNLRIHKKLLPLKSSDMAHLKFKSPDPVSVHAHQDMFLDSYVCSDYPTISSNGAAINGDVLERQDGSIDDAKTKTCCWQTPRLSFKRALSMKHQHHESRLLEWVLPCASSAK
ncbi:hypothetical protein Droror1_Dr00021376 [Drosera rotundifolia]